MNDTVEPLIHDLVAWCAASPRTYEQALDIWRTSCPRLMVWEEASARGLIETRQTNGRLDVVVTEAGRRLVADTLAQKRTPHPPVAASPI